MSEGKEANVTLTLLEFLETLSSGELSWNELCELFDGYCERANLPNTFYSGDWVELAPAFEALALMIRAGVFRADNS